MGYGPRGQWDTWAMGYRGISHMGKGGPWAICFQNIKKMSSCQKDVKLSKRCQMSKNETPRLWRRFTKNLIDTMRFTDIDVNFDVTNDGH